MVEAVCPKYIFATLPHDVQFLQPITSPQALALKYITIRKALDKGRAELHIASEQVDF